MDSPNEFHLPGLKIKYQFATDSMHYVNCDTVASPVYLSGAMETEEHIYCFSSLILMDNLGKI